MGSQGVGWKERYTQKTQENERLTTERNNLELQLNAEKAAKIQALGKLEEMNGSLKREYATKNEQLKAKETELAANTVALHTAEKNLADLTTEVQTLRNEIAASQHETDEQIKRAISLNDRLAVASGQLSVFKERNEQLVMDVSKAKQLLTNLHMSLEDPIDASKITVNGVITAVSRTQVELSIGVDDGVRIGQELDIYRGSKYVGRVRVIDTRPDNAVAAILTEYQQYPIQRGDNVASRLKST
jgi:chromosome segregation ATPase